VKRSLTHSRRYASLLTVAWLGYGKPFGDYKPWSASDIPYSTFNAGRSVFHVHRFFCGNPNTRTNIARTGKEVFDPIVIFKY
jgi:hypothetical protein